MNINVNEIMNYVTYALIAFGLMAFVVSLIVQAIKDLPWFKKLPTSAVALYHILYCMHCYNGCFLRIF